MLVYSLDSIAFLILAIQSFGKELKFRLIKFKIDFSSRREKILLDYRDSIFLLNKKAMKSKIQSLG